MNCDDMTLLLDDHDTASLSAAEHEQIAGHLAECRRCAGEWEAHERLRAAPIPPMPERLAARCRALVADSAAPARPRRAGRPLIVGLWLLIGAAAASLVSLERAREPSAASGSAGPAIAAEAASTAPTLRSAGEPMSARAPKVAAAATVSATPDPRTARAEIPAAGEFTVAIAPLRHETTHPDVVAVTEAIYAALLDSLRAVPNLALIELDEPVAAPAGQLVVFDSRVEAQNITLEADRVRAKTMANGQVLLQAEAFDRPIARAGSAEVSVAGIPPEPGAPASFVPPAGGAAGNSGAGEAIEFSLVRTDAAAESVTGFAPAAAETEPDRLLPYDFVLNVTSVGAVATDAGQSASFGFAVSGASRDNASGRVSLVRVGALYERIDPETIARESVEQLRKLLFEPDAALLEQLEAQILDQTATLDERLEALSELQTIARRSGSDRRSGPVVAAAIDIAVGATRAETRARVWRLMQGASDPSLSRPLVDALLYDPTEMVRLEAARALTSFTADPTVRAALEQASRFDASRAVGMQARWSSLDAAGRNDWVSASLLDSRLSDRERIEALLLAQRAGGFGNPEAASIDGAAAEALVGIVTRIDDSSLRSVLIRHLDAANQPGVVEFLLDRLDNDPVEIVRETAAESLRTRLDDPAVRAALERARAADSSRVVRDMATDILGPRAGDAAR